MKWIFLMAVIIGIGWTANWSYHLLDNAILITDYWKSQGAETSWELVNYVDGKPYLYTFSNTNGYWNIFKELWPVWTLFVLSFFVLIPLSNFIFNSMNNAQIAAAKEAQRDAEEQAKKARHTAFESVKEIQKESRKKIAAAHEKERAAARSELDDEWSAYHYKRNEILERESAISSRERNAQQMVSEAKQYVMMIKEENERLKRTTKNATYAYQRKQRQLDRK